MSVIVLDSGIVHYEVLGRGKPLLFLHSWVGSWRYWIPSMQAMSINYRTYSLDLWGYGESSKNNRYTLTEQADLVNQFMYSMGIMRVVLVGHGLGALAAIYFALQYPELVDRLMTVSFPLDDGTINPRLSTNSPMELAIWLSGRNVDMEPVLLEASKADARAIHTSLQEYSNYRLGDLICNFTTPCLYVHGQNDPVVGAPQDSRMLDIPPQSYSIIFEQSGHFPMLDESARFNRLVLDFLSLPSGESPRELQLKEEWKRRVR